MWDKEGRPRRSYGKVTVAVRFLLLAAEDAWQTQMLDVDQDGIAAMRESDRNRDRDRQTV